MLRLGSCTQAENSIRRSISLSRINWSEGGRAAVEPLRRLAKHPLDHQRHLMLLDTVAVCSSFTVCRRHDHCILQLCGRTAALSIAADLTFCFRWVPSERNPADTPSRVLKNPGCALLELLGVTCKVPCSTVSRTMAVSKNDICRRTCRFASVPAVRKKVRRIHTTALAELSPWLLERQCNPPRSPNGFVRLMPA